MENEESIPLPPDDLLIAVSGQAVHEDFRRSRLAGPRQFLKDLEGAGIGNGKIVDVLDFGCGCGRLLAGWVMLGIPFKLRGCDYNPALVEWCQKNIPGVSAQINKMGEPLPYESNSLDLVYLISVFTHLTIPEQKRLISEFRRILRRDGYVYITFHGEYFYPKMFGLVPNGEQIFQSNGFLIGKSEQEGSNECWTLHKVQNLIALFKGFIPIKHIRSLDRGPTDVGAWQDTLIFQKKSLGWRFRNALKRLGGSK